MSSLVKPRLSPEEYLTIERKADRKSEYYAGEMFAQEYILIAQDRPRIERYRRSGEQEWIFSATDGLENMTHLGSIGCDLVLADVYDRVEFAAAEGTIRLGPLPAGGK